ncbi:MAG: hypothetical protein LBJ63_09685 [Prevotellaceae bacterium]|jgi:hypothetical protein|nr:hypothetical protein [Prevotellaceae bacterium]
MKHLIIEISFIVCCCSLYASPQVSDFLIIEKDTIPVYNLILENYLQQIEKPDKGRLFGFSFRDGENMSFSCWRGYQAVYSLENDSLFLKYILPCHSLRNISTHIDSSIEKIKNIFNDKVVNGKVFIDWFSNIIAFPRGKQIWWDGIFNSIYDREEIYIFEKGILSDKRNVKNYQKVKGGISRTNNKVISNAIFQKVKKLDWKKLDNLDIICDSEYFIVIDEKGKISNIEINTYGNPFDEDDLYCMDVMKKQLQNLQFDIIKWHGEPMKTEFRFEIFYDDKTNQLENWAKYDDG